MTHAGSPKKRRILHKNKTEESTMKKITALLLAVLMLFTAVSAFAEVPQELQVSDMFPLSEPITMTILMPQQSDVVDLKDNVVFQLLKEYTNIDINLITVPSEDGKEKLNLLLNSGDYPEVIMGIGLKSQDLENYGVQEGILMPLNDLIDQYAPKIAAQLAEHPNWKVDMTCSDGNIYAIPAVDSAGVGHVNCATKYWINEQWLKNLGLEMPTTTEEFKNVLLAFKNDDPNGNGIADEIPLSGCINSWNADPYLFLLNAFGYFDTTYYYLKDGTFQSILDQDYMKKGLAYMNDLYNEGLIDPAAFTQDNSQMTALGNNADIEILGCAPAGHVGMILDINNVERYVQYAMMLPLEGPDGYRYIPYTKSVSVNGGMFMITDACKHPEVAIAIADLFSDPIWTLQGQVGTRGVEWDYADEGTLGMDGVTPAAYKFLQYQTPAQVVDAWWWTYRGIEPDWKNLVQTDPEQIMDPANFESRLAFETSKLLPFAADVDSIPTLRFTNDDSTTYNQLKTAIDDYAKIAITEFITGTRSVENDWDAYLADLESLGYGRLLELVQATYNAQVGK